MKILHIGIDSPFVDFLVAGIERHAPGSNELIVVSNLEPDDRVRAFDGPTTRVPSGTASLDVVREQAASVDVVVVHAMSDFAVLVCAELPPSTVLVWSGFGYDYYVGAASTDLIAPGTRRLLSRSMGKVIDASGRLGLPAEADRLEFAAIDLLRQRVAGRTHYFAAPVDADLAVFKKAFPTFSGEYCQLNYGDLASMTRAGAEGVAGDDILVGNSSSWANNHVEAFRVLSESDLGERKVVVPLTYGDPTYRDAVIASGESLLGERFAPIVDHLPLEEYLDIVGRCRVTLFNHRRQQGLGNIVAALRQGSYVYLNPRNPLYKWFRSHGVEIGSVETLRKEVPSVDVSPEQLALHRAFLAEMWGSERVAANLRAFVAELDRAVSASARRGRLPRGLRARRQQ